MAKDQSSKLTPERVVEILAKKGTRVDLEEAKVILNFINKIARIAVNQYLSNRI